MGANQTLLPKAIIFLVLSRLFQIAPETRRLKKIGSNSRGNSREYSMKFSGRKILQLAALLPCVASFLPQHGFRQNGNQIMEGHSSLVLQSKRNRWRNPPREEPKRTEDSTSSLLPVTPRKFTINLAATLIGALVGYALLSDDSQQFFLGAEYDQGYRVILTQKSCREIDQEPNSSLSSCKCLYDKGTYSVRYCKVIEDEVRSQPNNQVE